MTQHFSKHNSDRSSKLNSIVRNFSLLLCLGMLAGILIWSKLRLVTDIPRSAYADPRETQLGADIDPVDLLSGYPLQLLREESEAQESDADLLADELMGDLDAGGSYSDD